MTEERMKLAVTLVAGAVAAAVFFGGANLFIRVSGEPSWWGDYLAIVGIALAVPLSLVGVVWLFAKAWKGDLPS